MPSPQRLIWVSLLPAGNLDNQETSAALACAVTEADLTMVAQSQPMQIAGLQIRPQLARLLPVAQGAGFSDRSEVVSAEEADKRLCQFLAAHPVHGQPPLCARHAWLVREAIQPILARFSAAFHYRNIDLMTVSTLLGLWQPELPTLPPPASADPAANLRDDLDWLRRHRAKSFVLAAPPNPATAEPV